MAAASPPVRVVVVVVRLLLSALRLRCLDELREGLVAAQNAGQRGDGVVVGCRCCCCGGVVGPLVVVVCIPPAAWRVCCRGEKHAVRGAEVVDVAAAGREGVVTSEALQGRGAGRRGLPKERTGRASAHPHLQQVDDIAPRLAQAVRVVRRDDERAAQREEDAPQRERAP